MPSWAQSTYLTTEVMTATPQKLHLMLIEAAIRFAHQARQQWNNGENEEACESLIRAQDIVTHILGGLKSSPDRQLSRKVASVYLFVFRSLMEANIHRDETRLDGALKVLETERETWRQVCERLSSGKTGGPPHQEPLPTERAGAPRMPAFDPSTDLGKTHTGFSLEA